MKENWAPEGMPPENYDVLDRKAEENTNNNIKTEYIWLSGEHPHKGVVINGATGIETFVEIYHYPGLKPRFIKNYIQELPRHHPLYEWQQKKYKKEVSEITIINDIQLD